MDYEINDRHTGIVHPLFRDRELYSFVAVISGEVSREFMKYVEKQDGYVNYAVIAPAGRSDENLGFIEILMEPKENSPLEKAIIKNNLNKKLLEIIQEQS